MNLKKMLSLALVSAAFAACDDDEGGTSIPPAPSVGALIERMGRAGVNTAVTDPFNGDSTSKGANRDAYNVAAQSTWTDTYRDSFADNLGVFDGLDRMCGNQLLAGAAGAARYDTLAGALADDQIYVNTAAGTCTTYLAVEANATGVIANQDCGGRVPSYDAIDVTYSVFAIGALSGVNDGIANTSTLSATTFPFLADPQ